MQQPSQESASALLYRITLLEQQLKDVQVQLKSYVPVRENDLQLQNIQSSLTRMERDVIEMKSKQEVQDKEARERYEAQEKATAAVQIRFLISVVSTVVLLAVSIITAYAAHIFH